MITLIHFDTEICMEELVWRAKLDYSSVKSSSGDGSFDDSPWTPASSDSNPSLTAKFSAEMLVKQITVKGKRMQFMVEYKPMDKPWETEYDDDNRPMVNLIYRTVLKPSYYL
jgi:hypothetical protein